jgi:internalin A
MPVRRPREMLGQIRLIVLGDGSVGKTSVTRMLVDNSSARSGEAKTSGIGITKWPIQSLGTTIAANVWDFGGQGEMHAAHPYFFGRRTLYLLVVEGRQDHLIRERVGYWLDMIQSYAGKDARVIIVQNKADQHIAHLNEHEWRNLHPGLAERGAFDAVSCMNGSGIEELGLSIAEQVATMPSVWEKWPAEWMDVKNDVAQRLTADQPTLSMEEFARLCDEAGVTVEIEQTTLLKGLHDLGLVVAYPDDARLMQFGVLDPGWVRMAVYSLLTHPTLMARQGVLLESELVTLLAEVPGYRAYHRVGLMELMVKFELAFRTAEGWIIPGLLNPTAVLAAKSEPFTLQDKPLRFEFHYEMLPETLITRFIARKHGAARTGSPSWWRHGIILVCNNCPALVQAEVGRDGKVILTVAGPNNRRRDTLTVLRHAIDELHTPPQREIVQCKVPLPDCPDVAVNYEELMFLEEKGEKTGSIRHRGKSFTYLVAELLDGVGRMSRGDVFINHFHGDNATQVIGNVTGGAVGGLAAVIDRRSA